MWIKKTIKCHVTYIWVWQYIYVHIRDTHYLLFFKSNVMFVLSTLYTPLIVICMIKIYNQILEMEKISHLIGEETRIIFFLPLRLLATHRVLAVACIICIYIQIFDLNFSVGIFSPVCAGLCAFTYAEPQHKHPHGITLGFACYSVLLI